MNSTFRVFRVANPVVVLVMAGLRIVLGAEPNEAGQAIAASGVPVTVEGEILDAQTDRIVPARIYICGSDGAWHFPESAGESGSAIRYERRRGNTNAIEMHTTLSAHPFRVRLPPGRYTITIERGKEYRLEIRELTIAAAMPKLSFRLQRWVNMAQLGWFSGDTHVHRRPSELGNVMLAEDLNVALPMLDWTSESTVAPSASPRSLGAGFGSELGQVDATHVWFSRNTEYEIFRTGTASHRLGALLILNHQTRFDVPVFPLARIVEQARSEGALFDLEKHNWPWSIALVPILNVDLFELANNHHWRTEYAMRNWAVPAPSWMKLSGAGTDTDRDWTLYGFHTYYALLNCGFRLWPAAGSANGVHPVPLGFSRVYVHLDGPFSYEAWMRGLGEGRSFVTTGPMLLGKADEKPPGATFTAANASDSFALQCRIYSEQPLESIELIENGEIAHRFEPENKPELGAFTNRISLPYHPKRSSWVAWRCFERRERGRTRFAHTAPWYFVFPDQPIRPRREEADWLVSRVREEIARSRGIAPASLLDDYRRALKRYEEIAAAADGR